MWAVIAYQQKEKQRSVRFRIWLIILFNLSVGDSHLHEGMNAPMENGD